MSQTLTVSEKFSKLWPYAAAISLLLSVLFFAGYIYMSDLLIAGYLRLAAFAFFVIGFLSLFKLKDGQIVITYEHLDESPNKVTITYTVRDRNIHVESIDLSDIKKIKVDKMPNRSIYNDIYNLDRSVRLKKKNMEGWLYLNEIHGRAIPLSKENAIKIVNFIKAQKSEIESG